MLKVIDLMVYLWLSVGISVSHNYLYHSKYGIPGYARNKWYQAYQFCHNIVCYSDADWAGDIDTRRSTLGYLVIFVGGCISAVESILQKLSI